MKKIEIPKEELRELYLDKKLSSNEIAEIYDCSKRTILKRLRKYNIPRRSAGLEKREDLTKDKLKKLYIDKELSTRAIADKLDTGRSTVYRKLKKFDIETRDISKSHIKYERTDFSEDSVEKYYLLGFTIGDLRVRKVGDKSTTIKVDCGSTREEQLELFEDLFSDYGKIWKGGPYDGNKYQVEAFLNDSFSFLLNAREKLDGLPENDEYFLAFLAGFIDAEGSFFITNNTAKFGLGNYDKELLEMIKNRLTEFDIETSYIYANKEKYKIEDKYERNETYYSIQINRMNDLIKLVEVLKEHIRHSGRKSQIEKVRDNISKRKGG